jgi:hypothetical protein
LKYRARTKLPARRARLGIGGEGNISIGLVTDIYVERLHVNIGEAAL